MKILVAGTGGSIVSGISTAADQMAKTLVEHGYDVERLNVGERMRRRANTVNLENTWAVLADAASLLRRARRGRADVVWIHTFGLPALPAVRAVALAAAARVAGRPAVVHFHAYGLEATLARGGPALRMALRALLRLANATVVLYDEAAGALQSVGGSAGVHVVPNWVDVGDDAPVLPAQPPLRLVFVGGLVRRKGVPQLVEALRLLGDFPVHLRLVGGAGEDGPEALERLRAGTADLVAAGRLSFAGELNAAGVRAELQAAHLFVLPSEAEGTPISMLEAMAERRPVLVSDAGNMRAVMERTGAGWVLEDRRPETIAAALRRIASDPPALAEASAAAGRAAMAGYSAGARMPQLGAILTDLGT